MSKAMDTLSKLLAQAENTNNEAERQAFMEAAEQRAAILGVTLAMARVHHQAKEREKPEKRRFKIGDERSRYNAAMVELFCAVALPHDIKVTIGYRNIYASGYGFPSDLNIVGALFDVVSLQMVSDANAALRRGEQKHVGRWGDAVDGRVYRAHFYEGFTSALASRLWVARRRAVAEVEAEGQTGTELVLRDRAAEVKDFYEDETKHLRLGSWKEPQRNDFVADAVRKGANAAHSADIGIDPKVGSGARKEIGGAA